MGIFSKKIKISDLVDGLWDVHSHLLPGVDDGSPSLQESLYLLAELEGMGMEGVFFTPHIISGTYHNTGSSLSGNFDAFDYAGKVTLRLAAEYFIDESFHDALSGCPLTYDGVHILTEFSSAGMPNNAFYTLFDISTKGYIPVLAHPERYHFLAGPEGKKMAGRLIDTGCKFQMNLLSLTGRYGTTVRSQAEKLLLAGAYSFVGTDIHARVHLKTMRENKTTMRLATAVEKLKENNRKLFD